MTIPSLFPDEPAVTAPTPRTGAQTQSLYRKYRPQTFEHDELVGQDHIVRTLRNAIQRERLAHAYLFCGPRGTGKTTTARLLAKAVNCLHPDVMKRPCNECSACVAIGTNATSDVIEIDAASNRGIDDIRDLRERVKYAPAQLKTKFYIIDEAHQITGAAANAFLKTLEEPPPHTKFVLATTDPEELLPTIVSRCQRFDFRRISLDATIARLRTVALAESIPVSDAALEIVARNATGSLRDAVGLLDQLAVYSEGDDEEGEIGVSTVLKLLGVSRNDRVERLVEALATGDATLALSTVNDAVEAGEDPRQLNKQLVAYLRVLLHQRAGDSRQADARARELAAQFELHQLSRLARIFSETDYKIRHSPYAQLPLEIALVDAIVVPPAVATTATPAARATPGPVVTPAAPAPHDDADLLSAPPSTALRDRLRGGSRGGHLQVVGGTESSVAPPVPAVEQRPATPPTPATPARASVSAPGEISVDQVADLWPKIRADVKAVNRRIEALLASIDPVAVNGSEVVLVAAYEFHRKRMNDESVRAVVEDVVSRLFGKPLTVSCLLRGEEPATSGGNPIVRPVAVVAPPLDEPTQTRGSAPESPPASDTDERRVQAAKNIFDAEEITGE